MFSYVIFKLILLDFIIEFRKKGEEFCLMRSFASILFFNNTSMRIGDGLPGHFKYSPQINTAFALVCGQQSSPPHERLDNTMEIYSCHVKTN